MIDSHDELQEAMAAHQAGHFDAAQSAYERVLARRPRDAKALYFLGLLHFHRGAVDVAVKHVVRALAMAPDNAQAWNVLGSMLIRSARPAEAQSAYRKSIELAPQCAEGWYNLGVSLRDAGNIQEAVECLRTALARQPDFSRAYGALGDALRQAARTEEAADVYREWAAREPENAYARHMAAATSGADTPSRAADEFVSGYFDRFAAGFDEQLARLNYRAPEHVSEALNRHVSSDTLLDVLDAGCGTGLCGPLLRKRSRTLTGVDISERMADHARARGVYDKLVVAELTSFMRSHPQAFDIIVSADTLVYFGDLQQPLIAAQRALRAGGLLIFTVEASTAEDGQDHHLQSNGRFAHSESYVQQSVTTVGFEALELSHVRLRSEGAEDVAGLLVVGRAQLA